MSHSLENDDTLSSEQSDPGNNGDTVSCENSAKSYDPAKLRNKEESRSYVPR